MSYLAQCYRQDHRTAEEAAGTLRHWPFVRGIHQSQRALNAGFDVFFHVSLNKRFNKQCNAQCMAIQRNVFYFVTFCVTKIRKLVLRQTEQLWYLFLFAYFRKKIATHRQRNSKAEKMPLLFCLRNKVDLGNDCILIVRRAGLMRSHEDHEMWWSVPFACAWLYMSFLLFCLIFVYSSQYSLLFWIMYLL